MTWIAIPLAGGTLVSTLVGGFFALRLRASVGTLIALSGGVVVGVALFDVLPEAFDNLQNAQHVGWLAAVGFLAFFVGSRAVVLHHRDEPDQARAHARVGAFGAAAMSAHSLLDGLGIGFAFHVSNATGFLVFLAVVSHDFADGLNTVSFVLRQSNDRKAAMRWLALDAVAPVIGASIGAAVAVSGTTVGIMLALYGGFFLSMGATDLLPEAHAHPSWRRMALTVGGVTATWLIVFAATR
ncbi:MAG TPA: ZIP family metal transporter [Gaiellaceae bacterium]|nr:ZIP family metal transporter [Gaiellaceae bacterium]